jgi:alkylated DNA repair dioxygenase AlkB
MQANLFDGDQPSSQAIKHPIGNAELLEYPQIFCRAKADQMLKTLIADIPWQQEHLKIAGKLRAIPRLQCWMGDSMSEYGYSGVRLSPQPWNETVKTIHERVADLSGSTFNSVLINFYRNGQDSVAWHADDEAELGAAPVIASVSLGAERIFELKQKYQVPAKKYKLSLRHASLLIMAGTMQQHWLHQLPKEKALAEARINLTFRNIISD